MIKYGVGGRELGKPDETEIVLTHRGIVKRKGRKKSTQLRLAKLPKDWRKKEAKDQIKKY